MFTGPITIRKATSEDIPFLRAMMEEAIIASRNHIARYGLETMQEMEDVYWCRWDAQWAPSFVALDTCGKKLGSITLKPDEKTRAMYGWRIGIGVAPEARSQGIGRRLIEQAIAFARETGAHYINLHVDTANTRAIALYSRLGFVNVYQGQDLIEMWLLLNE